MAGITTSCNASSLPLHLGTAALLDMLAEVATQTLQHDPSLINVKQVGSTNNCESQSNVSLMQKSTKKNKPCLPISIIDSGIHQLSALSANRLIKAFSEFDGNEMRRTFTYTCMFAREHCQQRFSSFGSEGKARQLMKTHLLYHVRQTEQSAACGLPFAIEATKKRKKSRTNNINLQYSKAISSKIKPVPIPKELAITKDNKCTSQSSILKSYLNEEHTTNKTYEKDKSPVCNEHNYTIVKDKNYSALRQEAILCDPLEESEVLFDSGQMESRDISGQLEKFMLGEVYADTALEAYAESELVQLKHLPHVGQEVAISTTEETYSIPSDDLHNMMENDKEADCRDKSTIDNSNATVIFDGDTVRFKKPRGKPRFITQSKDDQDKAIAMIQVAKAKGSSLDPLECHICQPPRQFTALTTLVSHYRSHAGIKPYECRICSQVFTRQHSLNYHMLIHSNSTRFTCSDCGRKFRHPSHFKEHQRRHTGETPYECGDCLIRFKTRNTFKRHLKTRHGKVLTNTGGLVVLSNEELSHVHTPARSQTRVTDKSWIEVEQTSGKKSIDKSQTSIVIVSNKKDDKENTVRSERLTNNNNVGLVPKSKLNIDIIEEAMSQSDISYHEELYSNSDMKTDCDNKQSALLSVQSTVVDTLDKTVADSSTPKLKGFTPQCIQSDRSCNRANVISTSFPTIPVELTYNMKVKSSSLAVNKLKYSKVICTNSGEVPSPIIFNVSLDNSYIKRTVLISGSVKSSQKYHRSKDMLLNNVANNNVFYNPLVTEVVPDPLDVQL